MEQINLNLIPGKTLPVCHASQYDVGRVIRVNLFEGNQVFSFSSGDTAEIHVRKPDETVLEASLTVTTSATYVEIETTEQMTACAGPCLCQIQITSGSDVIGTLNFILEVEADPMSDGIESESVIRDLDSQVETAAVDAVGPIMSELRDAITNLNPYNIPPYMMGIFKPTQNIFSYEFSNLVKGGYYNTSGGKLVITTTPNWNGWLLRVKPSTVYTVGPLDFAIAFFDGGLNYISKYSPGSSASTTPSTITTPAKCYWMTITQRVTRDMSEFMVVEGDTYPQSYISGFPQWKAMPTLADDDMTQIAIAYSNNPIVIEYGDDGADITIPSCRVLNSQGAFLAPSGSLSFSAANWISYDKTADAWVASSHITGHELYNIGWVAPHLTKAMLLANFTESGQPEAPQAREWGYIYSIGTNLPKIKYTSSGCTLKMPAFRFVYSGGTISVDATNIDFTVANWLSYDLDAQELRAGAAVSGHTLVMLGVISPYRYETSFIAGSQIAVEKTIAILGDSISAGSGTNKVYHEYLAERYGFTCLNYAYGGSGYVRSFQSYGAGLMGIGEPGRGVAITAENYFIPNNIQTRIQELDPTELDGVIIFAGTNDWGNSIPFSDFVAGVDAVFDYFQNNFGSVPLLVMTPIHRLEDTEPKATTGKILRDYCEAIIEECIKYGIPYIDTMAMSGLHPDNAGNNSTFFPRDDRGDHASDGLHPNHIAHERIMRAIGETMNALVKYNDTSMR